MKKFLVNKIYAGENDELEVSYFLTLKEEYKNGGTYGVEILSKKQNISDTELYESEMCSSISSEKEEVMNILKLLTKFTVTPRGLFYALDEILSWDLKCQ